MSRGVLIHRKVVIGIYAIVLILMLTILTAAVSFGNSNTILLLYLLSIPVAAIIASCVANRGSHLISAYLAIAITSLPACVLGLPGGWGILYSIGVMALIWGAWFERWGDN